MQITILNRTNGVVSAVSRTIDPYGSVQIPISTILNHPASANELKSLSDNGAITVLINGSVISGSDILLLSNSDYDFINNTSSSVLNLYVTTSGNDTSVGTDPSLPLLTLNQALRIAGEIGVTTKCQIFMGAGVFPIDPAIIDAFRSNYYMIPYSRGGQGLGVEPPALIGTIVDSGFGVRTVGAFVSGTSPVFTTITDLLGGLVASAYKGWWIRWITGANAGKIIQLQDNGAAIITLMQSGSAGIVIGDTFVIEDAGTILRKTIPALSPAQVDTWDGGPCIFDGIVFDYVQNGVTQTVNFNLAGGSMGRCRFKNTGTATGVLAVNFNVGSWGLGAINRYRSTTVYAPKQNVIGGLDFVGNSSTAFLLLNGLHDTALASGRFENTSIGANSRVTFTNVYINNGSISCTLAGARASFVNMRLNASPGTVFVVDGVVWRAQVLATLGVFLQLSGVDMSNGTGTGNVVVCVGGIVQSAFTASGSGNVGVPWVCKRRGEILLSSPGVNETVSGAVVGDDVTVGGNPVTTYAAIATGATASVADYGATSTELCLVM